MVVRLFVLDGGEAHVRDISQWSPGVDVGRPRTFSNNVYLVQHDDGWLVWDTGLDERLVDVPDGEVVAHDVRGVVIRTLTEQLREIAVDPGTVDAIAFSHAHFDHVGQLPALPGRHLVRPAPGARGDVRPRARPLRVRPRALRDDAGQPGPGPRRRPRRLR